MRSPAPTSPLSHGRAPSNPLSYGIVAVLLFPVCVLLIQNLPGHTTPYINCIPLPDPVLLIQNLPGSHHTLHLLHTVAKLIFAVISSELAAFSSTVHVLWPLAYRLEQGPLQVVTHFSSSKWDRPLIAQVSLYTLFTATLYPIYVLSLLCVTVKR